MSRGKALAKNTGIISLGMFLPRLTGIITLPILTAYLSKAEFGTFDLINTLVLLLLPIATLRIETATFRFLIECRENIEESKRIISTMFLFGITVSVIVLVIFYMIPLELNPVTHLLICAYFLCESMYNLSLQVVRGFSKNVLFSVSAVANSVIKMLLIVVMVSGLNIGLNGALIATILAFSVAILVNFVFGSIYKYFSLYHFSIKKLKSMLMYSWPMVPNSLSFWVMNLSGRVIVTLGLGIEANAVLAVATRIPNLFTSVQGSFVFAWQENASLAVKDKDADDYYSKMFDHIFRILFGLMMLLMAISPLLFTVLVRGDYSAAYYQMPFLFGGMFFSAIASFFGGIYVAHKRTVNVGVTTLIAACISILISASLIMFVGIYAISIATFVSFAFLAIYRMFNVKKIQKIDYDYKMIVLCLGILSFMGAMLYVNTLIAHIVSLFIGTLGAIYFNYELIKSTLKKKRKE